MDGSKSNLKGVTSFEELEESWNRHVKLLSNKKFVNSLPDRGQKLYELTVSLEEELKKHRNKRLRANLNELNNRVDALQLNPSVLDSDDEDADALVEDVNLKLNVGEHKDVTQLIDSLNMNSNSVNACNSARGKLNSRTCNKTIDIVTKDNDSSTNKTKNPKLQSNAHLRWAASYQDSALYVPTRKFNKAKSISLDESLNLQKEQMEKLKELEFKHSMRLPGSSQQKFSSENDTDEEEEEEISDYSVDE